jgi:UDP-2,3-diacylglucosamine pyrophosphatase LpxH
VRTLIISDLHLGNRGGHDVLRLPEPRARLLEAIDGIDRLVLLGDTIELMTRNPRASMLVAEPVLREIGRRLGSDREVMLIAGNHDAPLVRGWALNRGVALGLDERLAPSATRGLEQVAGWLSPARVDIRYPGAWLEDGVWVTHGHYLDRHLLPESAFGLPRGRLRRAAAAAATADGTAAAGAPPADDPVTPFQYEVTRRRRRGARSPEKLLSRLAARPVATALELAAQLIRAATARQLPTVLHRAQLAQVTATVIDAQMRHASLAAMGLVVARLRVGADAVVFGHVHRAGPLNGEAWHPGPTQLLNCGSWLYEPLLLDRAAPPHPYWPGGAVMLQTGHPPRAVGLLDELGPGELTPR